MDTVYTDEQVSARLAQVLPHWTLEGGWIRRKYKTSGWKATLMVVNTVGHLAEAAWHHHVAQAQHRERVAASRVRA